MLLGHQIEHNQVGQASLRQHIDHIDINVEGVLELPERLFAGTRGLSEPGEYLAIKPIQQSLESGGKRVAQHGLMLTKKGRQRKPAVP